MSMESMIHQGPVFSLKAGAALNANRLVKIDATTNQAIHAVAGDDTVGLVVEDFASGEWATIYSINGFGVLPWTASAVIVVGNYVKITAAGKAVVETTATLPTIFTIGQALTASAADGDRILVVRTT